MIPSKTKHDQQACIARLKSGRGELRGGSTLAALEGLDRALPLGFNSNSMGSTEHPDLLEINKFEFLN